MKFSSFTNRFFIVAMLTVIVCSCKKDKKEDKEDDAYYCKVSSDGFSAEYTEKSHGTFTSHLAWTSNSVNYASYVCQVWDKAYSTGYPIPANSIQISFANNVIAATQPNSTEFRAAFVEGPHAFDKIDFLLRDPNAVQQADQWHYDSSLQNSSHYLKVTKATYTSGDKSYEIVVEGSYALVLTRTLALGTEYKTVTGDFRLPFVFKW